MGGAAKVNSIMAAASTQPSLGWAWPEQLRSSLCPYVKQETGTLAQLRVPGGYPSLASSSSGSLISHNPHIYHIYLVDHRGS